LGFKQDSVFVIALYNCTLYFAIYLLDLICKASICCALLTPQWKQYLKSTSPQIGDTWVFKCSTAWLDGQNKKYATILIITKSKNAHFFICKRAGFVYPRLRDFVKMTLTRVESFYEKRDSSRVIDTSHDIAAIFVPNMLCPGPHVPLATPMFSRHNCRLAWSFTHSQIYWSRTKPWKLSYWHIFQNKNRSYTCSEMLNPVSFFQAFSSFICSFTGRSNLYFYVPAALSL